MSGTMRPTWVLLLLSVVLSGNSLGQSPYAPAAYPGPADAWQYGPDAPPMDGPSELLWEPSQVSQEIPEVTLPSEEPEPEKKRSGKRGMGGPFGGSAGPGYGVEWFPAQPVLSQNVDFQLFEQNASAGVPIYRGDYGTAVLTTSVENTHFLTDAILPDTGRAFPDDLWDVKFGLTYIKPFDSGSTLGIISSIGSASDQPFQSGDEINLNLISFWRKPARNERDAWMLGVMYSPTGSLNFPVPILAYEWNRSESFQMNIGIPFSIRWQPREDWTLNVAYVPLTNGSVMLTHDLSERWHLYGGYRSIAQSYFLSDRVNKDDRFFALQQRLVTGIRWDVGKFGMLDLSTGYAFNRRYGEGENQGSTLHDEVKVEPGAFLGLDFRLVF